jgi:hypothetical protein
MCTSQKAEMATTGTMTMHDPAEHVRRLVEHLAEKIEAGIGSSARDALGPSGSG